MMKLDLKILSIILIFFISISIQASAQIVINEFMSDNTATLADQDGDYSDWIELYNFSNTPINLLNFSLSDQDDELNKWTFPAIIIPAQSFLTIIASGKNRLAIDELHTNFKISSSGESLYLSDELGQIINQIEPVALTENKSYGRSPDGSDNLLPFVFPTPNGSNNLNNQLTFEFNGGFYANPFFQKMTSLTDDTIYYTLDGSIPNDGSIIFPDSLIMGYKYSTANLISNIPTTPEQSLISYKAWESPDYIIDKANILRCATYKNGIRTSDVYTQTYIVDSVIFEKYDVELLINEVGVM